MRALSRQIDLMALPNLPISSLLGTLSEALAAHPVVIVQAPPGAGKTTLVPLHLAEQPWLQGQKIVLLEPRRVAARNSAQRMADLLGQRLGQQVGYRVRQDAVVGPQTQIEVITGGIFTRRLLDDPGLEGVGLVIFDEFHERHLDADLGLALSLQAQTLLRDASSPLRLLVMSATLDTQALQQQLPEAPVLTSEGRMFPVTVHAGKTLNLRESPVEPVCQTLLHALREHPGSALVFLPGQREILACEQYLQSRIPADCQLFPFYASLPLARQQAALAPLPPGSSVRKVVLATNIAETSLTLDGVTLVIDSGLCREPVFDPNTGLSRLQTQRISRASAIQRAGRAGRLGPGHCYRLWSNEVVMNEHTTAEILRADLAPLALQLVQWGVTDPNELLWIDSPPSGAYAQALDLLEQLQAIAPNAQGRWQLTAAGQQMLRWPLHPRLAHMLLVAAQTDYTDTALTAAALLSESLQGPNNQDLAVLVDCIEQGKVSQEHRGWLNSIKQQLGLLRPWLPAVAEKKLPISSAQALGFFLASAYPDRIAKARIDQPGVFQMANRRAVSIDPQHALARSAWLVVAEVAGQMGATTDRIVKACSLDAQLFSGPLKALTHTSDLADWDLRLGRFVAVSQWKLGHLVIQEKPLENVDPQLRRSALKALIASQGLDQLPWTASAQNLRARLALLHEHLGDPWPAMDDASLLENLDNWLGPDLEQVKNRDELAGLDLYRRLEQALPWALQQQLANLVPSYWQAPTGTQVTIDYTQSPPIIAVKLQEMFSVEVTPTVLQGRVRLCIHLLSPAQRPLQITQDLAGFWRSSYQAVKKEMKGRYPKHPWPDDPLSATPQRGVKKRPEGS
jgi:ATP-dependent helicase HrpB